ncbi:conserved hypothetical protein [Halorhabdus utahensis DSM 12940]|uniref:DUF7573 domain-containing protein n=1 Tax=Halorhabdus utahensis (strain DSM 12940 / JCM 11049 / AX-2) TaxID=519442 RepID=C7NNP4_HALUD|nr:hypothetical protein [Halorhabdus utahensis]ACV11569.1 conserved hypothetical protein [Halorhabdus utahensis DSM 12940]
MGDDASLNEFLGDEGESATATESADDEAASGSELPAETATESESADDEAATQTQRADEASEEAVEPATTTSEFAPAGAECDACGASIDRRWYQDGDLVCAACKDW